MNSTIVVAGTATLSPVRGLRPVRGGHLLVENRPNPAILTFPSLASPPATAASTVSATVLATRLLRSA